jgi:ADP-ribose pyrophosphatase
MKPYGPWKIKESNKVYVDPFIDVQLDQVVRPDGKDGQHVVVNLKPGVCVLAMDDNDCVHLTKEFHYGIGRDSIEGVSGGVEPGEEELLTAKRELQEELGLLADSWEFLTTVDPFTTVVVSPTQIYFARGLTKVESNPEGTELIELVVMPLADAVEKVLSGEITHAPTCVGLLAMNLRQENAAKHAS